ncbi:MAG TPA: S8 family serine peptidase, partial [Planctomycetota bacterium]|nr:S8 family serine peptidase [Planctomycetota bacterium]
MHFKKRSFTLDELRDELWGARDAARVARLVAKMEQKMQADQAAFVDRVEALSGVVTHQYWIINACAVDIGAAQIGAISNMPEVAYVEASKICSPHVLRHAISDKMHNAAALHASGIAGEGVAVAIIDSGQNTQYGGGRMHPTYYNDPKLLFSGKSRLLFNKVLDTHDVARHGTAVTSCAAGCGQPFTATFPEGPGHAYKSKIAAYTIAGQSNGDAYVAVMINAFQTMLADSAANDIRVANLSYSGFPDLLSGLAKAMDNVAVVGDILVCASAGNEAGDLSKSNATLNGISVGAIDSSKALASFSCRGYMRDLQDRPRVFPTVVGYGVDVSMAMSGSSYSWTASGTSFASPMIAGAASIVRAANKSLHADETKAILMAGTSASLGGNKIETGLGVGYVRDDYAHTIAIDPLKHGRVTIPAAFPQTYRLQVQYKKDEWLKFGVAWHRTDINSRDYPDIDVVVKDGTKEVLKSNFSWNTEEFVRFQVPADTTYTIEVYVDEWRGASEVTFGWACNRRVVLPLATITKQPIDTTIDLGYRQRTAVMSVAADNALSYQWRKSGLNLTGETRPELLLRSQIWALDAGNYDCVVKGPH